MTCHFTCKGEGFLQNACALYGQAQINFDASTFTPHIDVEARVGVPKSTIAETGMGVTSRP